MLKARKPDSPLPAQDNFLNSHFKTPITIARYGENRIGETYLSQRIQGGKRLLLSLAEVLQAHKQFKECY